MAVEELADLPVRALLEAVEAVRCAPAPVGLEAQRVAALAHASAELRGVFLRDLAAADPAAHGARGPADLLVRTAGVPVRQARRDAALARRLAAVPGLAEQVAAGGLELDAALQLSRAWTALPTRLHDEQLAAALVTLAQLVDLGELTAKVDELLGALAPDVTDRDLADARESAGLRLTDVGARTRIDGECDVLTGEFLREVLTAKAEADRGQDDGRSGPRRALDALVACLHAAVDVEAVPAGPLLVVVTDVDDLARAADVQPERVSPDDALVDLLGGVVAPVEEQPSRRPSWRTRSRGGLPLGPRALSALACESNLTRLVLDPLGSPLDSSPARRQLTRAERRALEHRAGYRCQRAGCGRPARTCVPHHVVPWALGGPSTQANTVLLCRSCHHLLHDGRRALLLTDGRRIGPRGWLTEERSEVLLL